MRRMISLLIATLLLSCNNDKKIPDTSGIKINVATRRFEKELFSLDTSQQTLHLDQLIAKYPSFGENFLYTILKFDPKWPADTTAAYLKEFIAFYRPVYDSTQKIFDNFSPFETEIKNGFKNLQYYFPKYKLPHTIITYIGPLDGYGNILDEDAIFIGLHQHLGKEFSLYKTPWVQETYPSYITARFEPQYISINCIKNIITDMYPDKNEDRSLVIQMIEKGKRLYLLGKLLPGKEEYQLIGYSKKQLKESYENEASIWDLFVQNNFLQTIDKNIIKNYIGESPKTEELGENSPGNIGSFSGWQIVKKYMAGSANVSLQTLMETDPETIFQQAKYKP